LQPFSGNLLTCIGFDGAPFKHRVLFSSPGAANTPAAALIAIGRGKSV
jgi:hypothetical protein